MIFNEINSKIELLIEGRSLNKLSKEREKLSSLYRETNRQSNLKSLASDDQRLAYITSRLPATYAVVYQVLKQALLRTGGKPISSLLDIGAGPGTALLAAQSAEISLIKATMIERDLGFIALGKRLTDDFEGIEKTWIAQDITKEFTVPKHDLVIASYCLNELDESNRIKLVQRLWELSDHLLILIEPGTKATFSSFKKIRTHLIDHGAHLIAPCPHSLNCPLAEPDWCHFSVRIERSSAHRKTKDATLNYEDEKFSYLIFSKNPFETCQSRVLRRPFKGEGFVKLQLCSKNEIENKTITKRNKNQYSYAKKIEWGDEFINHN